MSPLGWILLLVVLAAAGVGLFLARRRPEVPAEAPPPLPPSRDDLSTLGLSEVRARPATPSAAGGARFVDEPRLGAEPARADASRATPRRDEPRREDPDDGGDRPAWGDDGDTWTEAPVRYLLRSLAAHVGGAVAVVRHDGARFRVAARTDGGPLAAIRGAALGLAGPTPLIRADLGGLAALIGGEATAVPLGRYVVLIGGTQKAPAGYLDLLATLTGTPLPQASPQDADPEAPAPDDAAADDAAADDAAAEAARSAPEADAPEPSDDAPVPRATIIADEQAAAREAGRPLAFALVTLADAEERLTRGTPTAVATAEAALRERLASAPDVRRVEPFGDLLFGVFLDLEPGPTATWCDRLASGAPPLFIGAVAPAAGDPTGIRDAAAEALHDAYDQRRARVVEV